MGKAGLGEHTNSSLGMPWSGYANCLPNQCIVCVTSPPYWGLRAYGGDAGMIGLEPTLDEHLENLVAVFREVRRVLRHDGVLFLNYGDSYAGAWIFQANWCGIKALTTGVDEKTGKAKAYAGCAWLQAERPDGLAVARGVRASGRAVGGCAPRSCGTSPIPCPSQRRTGQRRRMRSCSL